MSRLTNPAKGEYAMNKKIRILVILAVLLASLACMQTTTTPSGADISGAYTAEGTNFDDSQYHGEATITKAADGSYNIVWVIAGDTQNGNGTLRGDTFTVRWQIGTASGDAIYNLQADGSLVGTWTADGMDGQGTETLRPK
jgi:hypothetical protein